MIQYISLLIQYLLKSEVNIVQSKLKNRMDVTTLNSILRIT